MHLFNKLDSNILIIVLINSIWILLFYVKMFLSMHFRIPPPGCVWAQRPKHIILAICLTDVKEPVIKVEKTKLYFKGVGGTEKKEHEVEMEFFKEIDVEVNGLNIEIDRCKSDC